jgi:hypothetical protein
VRCCSPTLPPTAPSPAHPFAVRERVQLPRPFRLPCLPACPILYPQILLHPAELPSKQSHPPLLPPHSCLCEACHHRQSSHRQSSHRQQSTPPDKPDAHPHPAPPCRRSRRPSRSSNPTTVVLPPKTAPAAPSRVMPKVVSARPPPVYPDSLSMAVAQGSTLLAALPAALLTASASLSTTRELQPSRMTAATVTL